MSAEARAALQEVSVKRLVGLLLMASFVAGTEVQGQSLPKTVEGTVLDPSSAAIPDAVVLVKAGQAEREVHTDRFGRFTLEQMPTGPATVTVSAPHFAPVTVDVPDTRPSLEVVLQPAHVEEVVEVRGPAQRTRTATKTDTPLRDVPQAISVLPKQMMADLNITNMADVVRYVPGVGYAQGEGNRDTPVFRGNSSTSDFYVDGVRDDVQYYRDVYNLERVEVLKGPNAMIFGRGGVGGVINRVQRVADWSPAREVSLQVGSFTNRRLTADVNQPVSERVAIRLSAMYEQSDSYRSGVGLDRYGASPTLTVMLSDRTVVRAGFERFHDDRTADRGIPSYQGRPIETTASTFFGNADLSYANVLAQSTYGFVEHRFRSGVTLRNRTTFADYDKVYQNVFPGAVDPAGTSVSISGYNNGTQRQNLFNQTDLTLRARKARVDHTLLVGAEFGRQATDNLRTTTYFPTLGAAVTSVSVPVTAPVTTLPTTFRPSATDADNHGVATVAAVYAQDQLGLTPHLQALIGVRYDAFTVNFRNNRTSTDLTSDDHRVSPRAGLIFKPTAAVSAYGSYSLSFQPRAGEQLSSLSLTNQALEPETFTNYEAGLKWDLARSLSLNAAVYELRRGNIVVTDPNNPAVSFLVDGQRTRGLELGATGALAPRWNLIAAYAYQDGKITQSLSTTARAGAVLANLPKHSLSLWNRYDVSRRIGVGVGLIYRGELFTSTDNTVVLPSYLRTDAAAYWTLNSTLAVQFNLENAFSTDYYAFANGNNNITPGSPRAVRASLTKKF
jgi:catecholate siderophore receptor